MCPLTNEMPMDLKELPIPHYTNRNICPSKLIPKYVEQEEAQADWPHPVPVKTGRIGWHCPRSMGQDLEYGDPSYAVR